MTRRLRARMCYARAVCRIWRALGAGASRPVDEGHDAVHLAMNDGGEFTNGDPQANPKFVSSAEIHACAHRHMLSRQARDPLMQDMLAHFGDRLLA